MCSTLRGNSRAALTAAGAAIPASRSRPKARRKPSHHCSRRVPTWLRWQSRHPPPLPRPPTGASVLRCGALSSETTVTPDGDGGGIGKIDRHSGEVVLVVLVVS